MFESIRVVDQPHLRAHFHVLAHFDLGGGPGDAFNPDHAARIARVRPRTAVSPARHLGRLHSRFRKAAGAAALPLLPLALPHPARYDEALATLGTGMAPEGAPAAVTQLADPAGARLVALFDEIRREELGAFLQAHLQATGAAGDQGLARSLTDRLQAPISLLFPEGLPVVVSPAEAIGARTFWVRDGETLRIATPPALGGALFPVLLAMVRQRTDRIADSLVAPGGRQALLRLDVAVTTAYHLLIRRSPAQVDAFKDWVRRRYARTSRHPAAAVEALAPMLLVPEEGGDAIRELLGERIAE